MARTSDMAIGQELEEIVEIIGRATGSVSRDEIGAAFMAASGRAVPSRTLQRRLERLIMEGRVHSEGESKSTVYRLAAPDGTASRQAGPRPLSAQGVQLSRLILRPLGERRPVGYDREWLQRYKPGTSWYLTKAERAHLWKVGETVGDTRPVATFARDILGRLLIDLAWASSRLEGNTYTRLDTQNLLEFGQRAEGKDAAETQMILNHKTAIEYLVGEAEEATIRKTTILSLHAALSENLLDNPGDEGRLREKAVSITGTSYTPTAIPQIIREAFEHIVATINRIPDPFEQALFAMTHIPYLQPFVDVNKRTSRLVANIPLIRANLCPLSFVGAEEGEYVHGTLAVYELRRTALLRDFFIGAYERSAAQYTVMRSSLVQPDPIRLRYRNQLRDVVKGIVSAGAAPSSERVRVDGAKVGIPDEELAGFAEVALGLLINLHAGSASRYGLRPREFTEWERRFRVPMKQIP